MHLSVSSETHFTQWASFCTVTASCLAQRLSAGQRWSQQRRRKRCVTQLAAVALEAQASLTARTHTEGCM